MSSTSNKLDLNSFYPLLKLCRFIDDIDKNVADTDASADKQELIVTNTKLRYVISLSGGLDSIVLLHLMYSLKSQLLSSNHHISAVYVNHNLSPSSSKWGDFCKSICKTYQISLTILSVNAFADKRHSPEEAARNARYTALQHTLLPTDCLLTAHHQSDQVETLLLQLFRGSSPKGLSAMPFNKVFFHSSIARPLLSFTRDQIKNYAIFHQLKWVEDESNLVQTYKRNFLRHSILPKLKKNWPGISSTLFRVSQIQAETSEILDQVAQQDLALCEYTQDSQQANHTFYFSPMLRIDMLKSLSIARVKNCLQYWLRKYHLSALNSTLLNEFIAEFFDKNPTPNTKIQWITKSKFSSQTHFSYLNYFQDKIFLCQHLNVKPKETKWYIGLKANISFGDILICNNFYQHPTNTKSLSYQRYDKSTLFITIKFRSGGESFKKSSNSHHFSLKNWFQENSIPTWLRAITPLFYIGDDLVQIGNTMVNSHYLAQLSSYKISFLFTQQLTTQQLPK